MPEGNEAVVRRLIEEVLNRGQTYLLTELVAADHVGHDPFGDHYGPEGMRIAVAEYRIAFPDLRVTVEDRVSEGDKVVHRFSLRGTHTGPFMGIPATGRVVTVAGIAIDRLTGGKLAESWVSLDALNLLRQLGANPVVRRPADREPSDTDSPPPGFVTDSPPKKGERHDRNHGRGGAHGRARGRPGCRRAATHTRAGPRSLGGGGRADGRAVVGDRPLVRRSARRR